jgi:hypothetical protein
MTRLQGHWFPGRAISFDDPLRACEIAARAEAVMAPLLCLIPDFRHRDMMVRLVGSRYGAGRSQACAALAAGAPCSLAPAQTLRISWTSFWKCQRPPILRCYHPHKPSFDTIQKGVEGYLGSSTPPFASCCFYYETLWSWSSTLVSRNPSHESFHAALSL